MSIMTYELRLADVEFGSCKAAVMEVRHYSASGTDTLADGHVANLVNAETGRYEHES